MRQAVEASLTLSAPDGYPEDAATKSIIDQLELIATEVEATPGQVALAWILTKNGFPVIGARTLAQLVAMLFALA